MPRERLIKDMKALTALTLSLLLGFSAAGSAASPEQAYLAARNGHIKALQHIANDGDYDKMKGALADLEAQLRRIIGPTTLPGFPAEGKIHLDTLTTEDEGFGLLDGLDYAIPLDQTGIDNKVSVVVTTRGLFDAWLRAHKTKWWNQGPMPQDLQAALKSDEFYRQALSTDAGVVIYAQLAVAKPSWAKLAYAVLALRTQDLVGATPKEMDIVVIGSARVYAVTAKLDSAVGPIAACDKIRAQFKARADAEKSSDKATKLEAQGERAFLQCFATQARNEPGYAAAVKQAQALIDPLPEK
jgi:hypothetical protein